jgi:hypothetical protein
MHIKYIFIRLNAQNKNGGCSIERSKGFLRQSDTHRWNMQTNVVVDRNKASTVVYRALALSGAQDKGLRAFQFFEKEFTYACHGPQAHTVATRFYTTSNVVKQDQGVDTVEVGTKMFATILQALLLERCSVEIWAKGQDYWQIKHYASPGDWSQVEGLLMGTTDSRPSFGSIVVNGSGTAQAVLGLAVISTSDCNLTIYDAISSDSLARYVAAVDLFHKSAGTHATFRQWCRLESLLVRHRIAECLLTSTPTTSSPVLTRVLEILKRNDVVVVQPSEITKAVITGSSADGTTRNTKADQLRSVAELRSLTEDPTLSESTATSSMEGIDFLQHLPLCALQAAEAACRHLRLLGPGQKTGTTRGYRLLYGKITAKRPLVDGYSYTADIRYDLCVAPACWWLPLRCMRASPKPHHPRSINHVLKKLSIDE